MNKFIQKHAQIAFCSKLKQNKLSQNLKIKQSAKNNPKIQATLK